MLKENVGARNLNEVGLRGHQCVCEFVQEFRGDGGVRMAERDPEEVGAPFSLCGDKTTQYRNFLLVVMRVVVIGMWHGQGLPFYS